MNVSSRDLHLFADIHEYRAYEYAGGSDFAFYHGPDASAEELLEVVRALMLRDVYLHGDVEMNHQLWTALRARQRNPFSSRIYTVVDAEGPAYPADDGKPDCRHCDNGFEVPSDFVDGACPKCGRDCIPF